MRRRQLKRLWSRLKQLFDHVDGRALLMNCYTDPEPELKLLPDRLKLALPPTAIEDQARSTHCICPAVVPLGR